jgi:hypothetical protein
MKPRQLQGINRGLESTENTVKLSRLYCARLTCRVPALLIQAVSRIGTQLVNGNSPITLAENSDFVFSEKHIQHIDSLILGTRHSQSYGPMLLVVTEIASSRLCITVCLCNMSKNHMVRQVLMRRELTLIAVLIVLVRVNGVTEHCVTNQFSKADPDITAVFQLLRAHENLFVDFSQDVVTVVVSPEEVIELGVVLLALGAIEERRSIKLEVFILDYAVDVPVKCQPL